MTTPAKVLETVRAAGGDLWRADDGALGVRAPRPLLPTLREHKDAILALLALEAKGWEIVSIGPWQPGTPKEETESHRRVLEMGPRHWWWLPRYRLLEMELGGLSREKAIRCLRDGWQTCAPGSVDKRVGTHEHPR